MQRGRAGERREWVEKRGGAGRSSGRGAASRLTPFFLCSLPHADEFLVTLHSIATTPSVRAALVQPQGEAAAWRREPAVMDVNASPPRRVHRPPTCSSDDDGGRHRPAYSDDDAAIEAGVSALALASPQRRGAVAASPPRGETWPPRRPPPPRLPCWPSLRPLGRRRRRHHHQSHRPRLVLRPATAGGVRPRGARPGRRHPAPPPAPPPSPPCPPTPRRLPSWTTC